jgi:signal transduction histidine kinase
MYKNKYLYNQFVAMDVSMLHEKRKELEQETIHLQKVQDELFKLSSNIIAITREEEILNTKMRVHDEMGRCLVEARKYLREDTEGSIPTEVVRSWQRAVSMLKYNNDTPDEDILSQIRKACTSLRVHFVQTGNLPDQEKAAYLLTCAIRECVTNAVRHAEASELYASFTETETTATVTVTNNGKPPEGEISEGGGLSTLRRRVEREGGSMVVQADPQFSLTVTVPKQKEGFL